MDRLSERSQQAELALARFEETAAWDLADPIFRDSAIKRFELSFETAVRALQSLIREDAGLVEAASKRVFRAALDARVLSAEEVEAALAMANDRNLSVHIYREEAAVDLARRIPEHRALLGTIVRRLRRT